MIDFPQQCHDHLPLFTASIPRKVTILQSCLRHLINFLNLAMKKEEQGEKEAKLCCCPLPSSKVLTHTLVAVNVLECIEPKLGSA